MYDNTCPHMAYMVQLPHPESNSLRLFLVSFDANRFETTAFKSSGIACPPSISRSARKRQAEFFFGRLTARAALQDLSAPQLDVRIGELSEPIWPAGFVGSISHTQGWAGAVAGTAARNIALGIDLERTATKDTTWTLERAALVEAEIKLLHNVSGVLSYNSRVTLAFSAKESFYKAAFGVVRRFLDFDVVRVVAFEEHIGIITLQISQDLHPSLLAGGRYQVGFGLLSDNVFATWMSLQHGAPALATPGST
jgi:4'-phosphopantetheinyl transferase EntD